MTSRVYRWLAAAAGLIFLAMHVQAQSPSSVTDAQIRFCLSRTDPQCKRVGLALLDEGRIAEGFEISRIYAEQGDTDLQMILGSLILMRRTPGRTPHASFPPNWNYYAQASRYWFEKAAQNGNPAALHSLACVPTAAFPNWVQDIPRQKFKQLCPISSERLSKVMHRLHVCLA